MLFSSYNPKTVARHFKWMQEYGIDGVFLQRFGNGVSQPNVMKHYTRILSNVRESAAQYGRVYGVMYDLSGMGEAKLEPSKPIGRSSSMMKNSPRTNSTFVRMANPLWRSGAWALMTGAIRCSTGHLTSSNF